MARTGYPIMPDGAMLPSLASLAEPASPRLPRGAPPVRRWVVPIAVALCAWLAAPAVRGDAPTPGAIRGAFVGTAGAPLAAVEVVIRRAADSTVVAHTLTGDDGRFELSALPLDRYLLRASLLGHVPLRRELALTPAGPVLDLGRVALAVEAV